MTGVPVVLLRLHGCAVGCHFCDTVETWHLDAANRRERIEDALGANPLYADMTPRQIAAYIGAHHPGLQWILLTGGEPAQYDLAPLVRALRAGGYKVMLETSGTADGHLRGEVTDLPDWVCVSPKINNPGKLPILPSVMQTADEIKMVVGKAADIEALEELLESCKVDPVQTTICLQPMSTGERATRLCIAACQAKGYRLSVQTHKYISVR